MLSYLLAFTLVLAGIGVLVFYPLLKGFASTRMWLALLVLLVPLLSLGVYSGVGGFRDAWIKEQLDDLAYQTSQGQMIDQRRQLQLMEAVRRRAEQLDSGEYWFLLASQHMSMGEFREAARAYGRAVEVFPDDLSLLVSQAEALFLAEGYRLTAEVQQLIDRVRARNPEHPTINGLLGIAAFRVGEWQLAIDFWERVLRQLPPMSPEVGVIRSSIVQAREMLNQHPANQAGSSSSGSAAALPEDSASGPGLDVRVELADGLDFPPHTAVFVFARPASGGAMPLAVQRLQLSDLPAVVRLSDADAMLENLRLSLFDRVDLVARVSPSGSATPALGDYQVILRGIDPAAGGQPLVLIISEPVTP